MHRKNLQNKKITKTCQPLKKKKEKRREERREKEEKLIILVTISVLK